MATSPVALKVGRFERANLFMSQRNGRKRARNLIIVAHGALPQDSKAAALIKQNRDLYIEDVMAVYAEGIPRGDRTFHFYGPVGKFVTFPLIQDIISGDRHTVPFEIRSNHNVEDYILYKYLNTKKMKLSRNKADMHYGDIQWEINDKDPAGNWHVFSVKHRNSFVGNSLYLSQAITIAEAWNEQSYVNVYCCFCRAVMGATMAIDMSDQHTVHDNRAGRVRHT